MYTLVGFWEKDLKNFWEEYDVNGTFEIFQKFMIGQTVSVIEGNVFYYQYDVQNFCSQYGAIYPKDIVHFL